MVDRTIEDRDAYVRSALRQQPKPIKPGKT
jgi:hypothetical protein